MLGSAEILPHVRLLQFCEQGMYAFFARVYMLTSQGAVHITLSSF